MIAAVPSVEKQLVQAFEYTFMNLFNFESDSSHSAVRIATMSCGYAHYSFQCAVTLKRRKDGGKQCAFVIIDQRGTPTYWLNERCTDAKGVAPSKPKPKPKKTSGFAA